MFSCAGLGWLGSDNPYPFHPSSTLSPTRPNPSRSQPFPPNHGLIANRPSSSPPTQTSRQLSTVLHTPAAARFVNSSPTPHLNSICLTSALPLHYCPSSPLLCISDVQSSASSSSCYRSCSLNITFCPTFDTTELTRQRSPESINNANCLALRNSSCLAFPRVDYDLAFCADTRKRLSTTSSLHDPTTKRPVNETIPQTLADTPLKSLSCIPWS